MSDMRKLIESMDKFAGEKVGQKPGDQVRGTDKATPRKDGKHPFAGRLVGASESKNMLADLEKDLKENAVKHSLAEQFANFKVQEVDEAKSIKKHVRIVKGPADVIGMIGSISEVNHGLYKGAPKTYTVDYTNNRGQTLSIQLPGEALRLVKPTQEVDEAVSNPQDAVSLDIPLLIRLLEYAREDAKTDMDLHNVAERLIQLSAGGNTLSMEQYNDICPGQEEMDEDVAPPVATAGGVAGATQPSTQNPAVPGVQTAPVDPAAAALAKQQQSKLQQNLANLKTAGVQLDPAKAAQTLQKTDTGAQLNAMDKDNIAKMAPAIGNVMSNPQTATQLNTLIKKAGGGV